DHRFLLAKEIDQAGVQRRAAPGEARYVDGPGTFPGHGVVFDDGILGFWADLGASHGIDDPHCAGSSANGPAKHADDAGDQDRGDQHASSGLALWGCGHVSYSRGWPFRLCWDARIIAYA